MLEWWFGEDLVLEFTEELAARSLLPVCRGASLGTGDILHLT